MAPRTTGTPPTALVLLSHGSLLCGAGQTLMEHATRLRDTGTYMRVEAGYLNYSKPPFEEAVEECVAAGARRIVVVPYFLVPGKFVRDDIPARVEAVKKHYPAVKFVTADPMGWDPGLADAIIEMAARASAPTHWRADMLAAPLFCEGRDDCPLHGTDFCPRTNSTQADL